MVYALPKALERVQFPQKIVSQQNGGGVGRRKEKSPCERQEQGLRKDKRGDYWRRSRKGERRERVILIFDFFFHHNIPSPSPSPQSLT